jgi:hypothetical protein
VRFFLSPNADAEADKDTWRAVRTSCSVFRYFTYSSVSQGRFSSRNQKNQKAQKLSVKEGRDGNVRKTLLKLLIAVPPRLICDRGHTSLNQHDFCNLAPSSLDQRHAFLMQPLFLQHGTEGAQLALWVALEAITLPHLNQQSVHFVVCL